MQRLVPIAFATLAAACSRASTPLASSADRLDEVVFDAETRLEEPVVLPLLEASLPMIEVEIEGAGPARFVVDSGMEISLLDSGFARRHGLTERPVAFPLFYESAAGVSVRVERAADVAHLRAGEAEASRLHMPLCDLEGFPENIDGMLGQDVIGDWGLLFLPEGRELVLLPGDDVLKWLSRFLSVGTPLESIPLAGEDRIPHLELEIQPGPIHVEMTIDTGSTATTLPEAPLTVLGVKGGTPVESTSLSGKSKRNARRVQGFPLGKQRIDLVLECSETDHGLLGWNALSQRIFVLDGPGRRLLIEASKITPPR